MKVSYNGSFRSMSCDGHCGDCPIGQAAYKSGGSRRDYIIMKGIPHDGENKSYCYSIAKYLGLVGNSFMEKHNKNLQEVAKGN